MALTGAEKLIGKIADDAQRDAERYWQETEDKKRALREAAEREIAAAAAKIEREAQEAMRENERRMAAVAGLEYRKQLLAARQQMMDKARARAMELLLALDDETYAALMKKRLLECAASSGGGAIAVGRDEKRLSEDFLKDVNAALGASGGKGGVTLLPERRGIRGGFVYVEGGMEINVSLEVLLAGAWHDAETDVARILFE